MRRGVEVVLAILFVVALPLVGLGSADLIPPELTVPPDVTIGCSDSIDPANTGQATATDESDPSPVVTYVDGESYAANGATTIHRVWTATDASGNTSSGEQSITVTAPSASILGADPSHVTSLPNTVTVSFTVDGCAEKAQIFLADQNPPHTGYSTSMVAIVSDGTTVNEIDVTLPAGAADSIYRMYMYLRNAQNVDFKKEERDFVTVGANPTPPELTSVEIWAPISYFAEYAREDELIRIDFESSIPLANTPVVTILGRPAVVTNVSHNTEWKAEFLLLASDPEGIADFTIDYVSLSGVPGDQVTTTTDGSWVMYDQTPPSTPVLVEPADGATETHGSVYFLCEESTDTGCGIWRYHWYDSHGNHRITSRSHAHDYNADDTFTWWMKAEDYAGNYSDPSPARTLNIYLTPELIITETGGSTDVAEGVPGVDLVKVQFNRDPGADVDVIVTPDAQLDVGEGPATPHVFHFHHGTDPWDRTFEIETGAVDDAVVEDDHTGTLQIATSCTGNPHFDGLSESVTVNITDNDDGTPPVLTIPPDVTIGCDESTLPANTGQATATDNMDPSPVVTYTDTRSYGTGQYTIHRTWTATDASSNTSVDVQQITVTGPSMSVVAVDPEWTNSLPTTFTISFTVDGCSTYALGYLQACTHWQTNNYFGDSRVSIVSDGTTVNTVDVTIPAGADEDMYRLEYIDLSDSPDGTGAHFMTPGPDPLVGVDFTPPVLTVPADVTIACDDPSDPPHTGQATATDNLDPSPTITYTESYASGLNYFIYRTWTATDAAGNSSSGTQKITVVRPGMTALGVSEEWINTLPTTVTIWFTLEKCATRAKGYLNGLSYGPNSDHMGDEFVPVVSDGVTVNSVDVTLPADADEDKYMLVMRMRDAENRHFDEDGPYPFVIIDLTDPVLTVPADVLIDLGDSTDPADTGQATATDNYDPDPDVTYTDSAILSTEHPEIGVIERTWRAEDAAGNFDEGIQLIRVDLTPSVAMAVIPAGAPGEETILDLVLDLAEGEEPPMIGTLPLSAIYIIGDVITGACTLLDGEGVPLTDSRIFLYLYLVTIDGMTETRTEVASALITCDRATGEYCFHLETAGLEPGIYDIYLGFEDGSSQILRIELQAAPN